MGACEFEDIGFGRTAQEAFADAVRQARYEYGHGGYTGTIAEKSSFVEFTTVKGSRYNTDRLMADIAAIAWTYEGDPTGPADAARARLAKAFGAHQVDRIVETYDDKWGPAVAVEITGKAATDIKARNGRKGTRARVFRFAGMASS